MPSRPASRRVVLAAALLLGAAGRSWSAPLQIGRSDAGLTVTAAGVPLEDVLGELAAREGFAVAMQRGVERPLVDVDVRDATLDEVLRKILQRRNYAIAYEEVPGGLAVSRVEVLQPRSAQQDAAEAAQRERAERAIQRAQRQSELRRQREAARQNGAVRAERLRQGGASNQVRRLQVERVESLPLRRRMWRRLP